MLGYCLALESQLALSYTLTISRSYFQKLPLFRSWLSHCPHVSKLIRADSEGPQGFRLLYLICCNSCLFVRYGVRISAGKAAVLTSLKRSRHDLVWYFDTDINSILQNSYLHSIFLSECISVINLVDTASLSDIIIKEHQGVSSTPHRWSAVWEGGEWQNCVDGRRVVTR
jgi:hypothetical protein